MIPRNMSTKTLAAYCLPFVGIVALYGGSARAQHLGDVQIVLDGNQLVTRNELGETQVFVNEFDSFGGVLFTDDPGFESQAGSLPGGTAITFNILQSLWYWDGVQLVAPQDNASIRIALGPVTPVLVTGVSGAQPGFAFATASASGTIHTHLSYTLAPLDTAFGVYGVVLELTAPQFEASAPFLFAFNYGLTDLDEIFNGVDAIVEASGILEPPAVPGDTDGDGDVDVVDLNNVRNNFGASGDPILGDTHPFNGAVDIQDLNNVRNNFGVRPDANSVPEPATFGLALLVALSLLPRITQRRS
jgi:hypothetical protein